MGYKICPKCGLNYITDDEQVCVACLDRNKTKSVRSKGNISVEKRIPRQNIAFKCNFCDGGKIDGEVGFRGACSDSIIKYNVSIGRTWCSADECPCKRYLDGKIDRTALDDIMSQGNFVCYESSALIGWKMAAGFVVKGKNKGAPNRLLGVRSGSLCVMTTVDPYGDSRDRYIFGLFIVERSHEGDDETEGDVVASEYKLVFTETEAHKLRFWDFYKNKSDKAPYQWGTGLFRYLTDAQALAILNAAVEVKKGTHDEKKASEIMEYFKSVNGLQVK